MTLESFLTSVHNGLHLTTALAANPRLTRKLRIFEQFMLELASLSTCKRLAVGCIIITPEMSEISAIGYNGPPIGEPNDSCTGEVGACRCVHAEMNAIAKLRTERSDLVLLTTTCPCPLCAGLIINSRRVNYVVYRSKYRDQVGLTRLKNAGLVVVRLPV